MEKVVTSVLLEARNITKAFPGVKALDDVSLTVHAGEIVAIVGHNGSGKSTLVKILAGVYHQDEGSVITAAGEGSRGRNAGLHFIHQDLGLISTMSTVENLDLSRTLGTKAVRPSPIRAERAHARALTRRFGAEFDVDAQLSTLTPAERTIVAIARALDGWTSTDNVLVLDEPTAALQGEEVGKLFEAVRSVSGQGAGVVLISHRLDEVVEIADRVVILRDGRVVGDHPRGEFDKATLVRLIAGMSGDDPREQIERSEPGHVRLRVRGLTDVHLAGIDLDVRAGEIVGVTGLLGSGMEQVAATIFGATRCQSGTVEVDGTLVEPGSPIPSIAAGLGYVPSDRRRFGAVVSMTATENLTLPRLAPLRRPTGVIDRRAETAEANTWMDHVGVRPARSGDRAFNLFSGGNQQKVVIAKWLRNRPHVLLLEEPTQGVDVAAQASIHDLIAQIAGDGTAVLVSSTDTKELVTLCHRVLVLHEGRATASLTGAELTEPALVRATIDTPAATQEGRLVVQQGEDRA
jgi:ABC-type sugar transport system ATPase subunit